MLYAILGFPGSDNEKSTYSAGDPGSIPGLGRFPGGGHGNPLQYSCLENLHGQRSLEGYSPWGGKESDTTERLSIAHTLYCNSTERDPLHWRIKDILVIYYYFSMETTENAKGSITNTIDRHYSFCFLKGIHQNRFYNVTKHNKKTGALGCSLFPWSLGIWKGWSNCHMGPKYP